MTLLDSLEATMRGANKLAERFGLPPVTKESVLSAAFLPTNQFWEHFWGKLKDEWLDFLNSVVMPEIVSSTQPFPEGEDILRSAKGKGYRLAVASNRAHPWHDLAVSGLGKYFDTVVGFTDVPRPKPEPDMLLAILRQLEIEAQSAIYLGDSEADMRCAKAAEITAIGLTQGGTSQERLYGAGATYVRPNLASCRDILDC
jgi:phosphoglycolate phosphatase